MVPLASGWSVGDILAAARTLYELSKGFRDLGGAKDQFTVNAAWLESISRDLQRVHAFMTKNPSASCIVGLQEKLLQIQSAYIEFESYLEKFDLFTPQLQSTKDPSSHRSWRQVKKATQTIKWAWKGLTAHVTTLRVNISIPLAEMNLILLLELCSDFQSLHEQCQSLPTNDDISQIRDMIKNQTEAVVQLAVTADEIRTSIVSYAAFSHLFAETEVRCSTNHTRALMRMSQIQGHLNPEHVELLYHAQLEEKAANENAERVVMRIQPILQLRESATNECLSLVDRIGSKLSHLVSVIETSEGAKAEAAQISKEIEIFRQEQERSKATTTAQSTQQLICAGGSAAAAMIAIASLMSTMLQSRWERAVLMSNMVPMPNVTPLVVEFERKWAKVYPRPSEQPVSEMSGATISKGPAILQTRVDVEGINNDRFQLAWENVQERKSKAQIELENTQEKVLATSTGKPEVSAVLHTTDNHAHGVTSDLKS